MQNSTNQQDRDQRKNSSMEDSPAMTIEFLRARLLSERAVSKTARQRADELANRVVELEEQLKFVSLQRKKAEKATADVLAILENHGMSELSEEFDSSSDQEMTHCESKVGNNSVKEESSVALKVRGNDVDEFSGSELESVSLSGRSLSWKSGKDSPHSREKKYMNSSNRRRRSSASIGFESPKQRVGKSCRRIRSRETRSADGDLRTDTGMLTPQANGVATCSEGFPNCSDTGSEFLRVESENQGEQVLLEGPLSGGLENQRDVTDADNYINGHGSEKDMERALEHQAELIERYEAEEKAQREWEEKFRENNSSTPDSCDPGNNSDITEERDEIKAPAPPYPALTISSEDQEGKSKMGDALFTKESSESHINGFQPPPHVDMGCLQDKKCSSVVASESPASDFAFPMATGSHIQECSPSNGHPASGSSHQHLPSQGSLGNPSADMISSSHEGSSFFNKEGRQNELALMPRDTSNKLGSVLEALQQAKLSLKHNLNRFPLIEGGSVGKAIEPSVPAMRTGDRVEVPIGCAGLFRVPTDSQFEGNTRANFLHSGSRLSLTNYYPDTGYGDDRFMASPYLNSRPSVPSDQFLAISSSPYTEMRSAVPSNKPFFEPHRDGYADDRFMASPYLDSRPSVPSDDQFLAVSSSPYTEMRSTVPSNKPFFEPHLDLSVPSSSRFMASPYFESRPSVPIDNRFLTMPSGPYTETRSTLHSRKPFFEPCLDVSVPSSSRYTYLDPNLDMGRLSSKRYTYPTYPSYPLHTDLMPRVPLPSNGALSKPLSNGETGMPLANNFSLHDNHVRPNMYR
ncbi:uncharacterized protein LOC132311864 [Cornus florida]|uniref:uncharacterized protein LOC132311864 n=1 Tax=Cornus florida TaxID=4283 RepID=UPI00289CED08|nr:uncharacterized protein LOC132311864 [Cornus florida]